MPAASRSKILLLGDSLTQFCFDKEHNGWGRDLANRYQRRADVCNRGMSGYNTRWYLRYANDSGIWNEWSSSSNSGGTSTSTSTSCVVLVTIFFGANDAATLDQHVPLDEYSSNLTNLIETSRAAYPAAKILLITPPPVAESQRKAYLENEFGEAAAKGMAVRTSDTTGKYAAACVAVAAAQTVPCLDLFTILQTQSPSPSQTAGSKDNDGDKNKNKNNDESGMARFFCDGLHFAEAGNRCLSEALAEAIHTHFPTLEVRPCSITGQHNNSSSACSDLSTSGPYHDAIKQKSPDWQAAFE